MIELTDTRIQKIVDRKKIIDPNISSDNLLYYLGKTILRFYFGKLWVITYLDAITDGKRRKGREYFRTDHKEESNLIRNKERVLHIAEVLVNLQSISGIDEKITELAEGKIETTLAELEFGWHIFRRGINFEFVRKSGNRGEDFDIRILHKQEKPICCEIKCKIENTDQSRRTVINSLTDARKQLPSEYPGIVGIKIPEEWMINGGVNDILQSAMDEFFRNSKRVIALLVRWEEVRNYQNGAGCVYYYIAAYKNPHILCDEYCESILQLLATNAVEKRVRFHSYEV